MPLPGRNSLPIGAQSAKPTQARACYNCRRRRLRCDRSILSCRKCSASGEECLGYGTVLRWANAPALRGRLAPGAAGQLTVQSPGRGRGQAKPLGSGSVAKDKSEPRLFIHKALNPLLNHLSSRARHYVHHSVCQDLVSFDRHDQNPFRVIIPLAEKFDFLQAIIVATGAMHLAALHGFENNKPSKPALVNALVAKDKAIKLLRVAVDDMTPANQPMVLAGTVFLVNLELIDSGKGEWQAHMAAASTLMSALHGPIHKMDQSLMACVDAIAADCLTYHVLGSAISGVPMGSWTENDLADFFPVLKRAEAYSYHCCPPEILQILLSASRLCSKSASAGQSRAEDALVLVYQARSLDVTEWVHSIRGLSAKDDLDIRVSIGLAHRATVCLYILLAVPEAVPSLALVDMLVQEVLGHLAAVPVDHIHLKATIWPTFMVGAQTDDPSERAWCIARMQAVSSRNPWICPWGYIRTAMQTMHQLWAARDRDPVTEGRRNWLLELKSMRDKCLIV